MLIDETRSHGPSSKVDAPRGRPRQARDVLGGADGNDPIALHGDGLRDRELVVHGNDLSIGEDDVWRRARRAEALGEGGSLDNRRARGERADEDDAADHARDWCHLPLPLPGRSSRTTTPPFITNFTRSISVTSASGSPLTATRSAYLPFSSAPTLLFHP